ncbi:S41 family peptidase [Lutibacter sp.]|uniref:S41 family peptidase n=1 Tax=Lutibacter sp. TaxID=1925666 RepID=UPI0035671368
MKKLSYALVVYLVLGLTFGSCNKNDEITPDIVEIVKLENPINNFIWKGMNSWYNWQSNVPNLANTKDDNLDAYNTFLNGYSTPDDLFYSLLFQEGTTDRFSWIVDDFVALNNSFQGISKSFGMRLQAVLLENKVDIIFYVRYVAPNSPASDAGIIRGNIINALDGIVLNEGNYSATVSKLSNETVTLSIVSENGGILTPIEDKTITAIQLSEDPVYFKTVFPDISGKKVGYLVYNGFRSSYNDELNAAFADFKNEGIDELVLDLRLNGGGSVLTSAYLASMIDASAGSETFAKLTFNAKHSIENGSYTFQNTLSVYDTNGTKTGEQAINRLSNISQLYVLTSGSTASASEMIINGLKAFMPVKVIGTTTYGKNVGSITLYDSPSSDYTSETSANSAHLYAMQPIVFQIYNKDGQSDYINGFVPDIEVKEYQFWNTILPFGDENEVVLKAALDDIRGITAKQVKSLKFSEIKEIEVSKLEKRFDKEMYITDEFFNQ